jgi:UDP-N-acetylmuramoyl-tripeptide--D-alanyl-D-alanine ligase
MNPASARAALLAMSGLPSTGRRIVVFCEMKELGVRADQLHAELGAEVAERGIDLLVTVGSRAAHIAAGAEQAGLPADRIIRTNDQGETLERLLAVLRPHDRLLCKASHSVGFDRLVDALTAALAQRESGRNTTTTEPVAVTQT